MLYTGVEENNGAVIIFLLFSHYLSDRSYSSYMILSSDFFKFY